MTSAYHRAFIDPVPAGYLVTFMVSDCEENRQQIDQSNEGERETG